MAERWERDAERVLLDGEAIITTRTLLKSMPSAFSAMIT
jgi:hypothetical protein